MNSVQERLQHLSRRFDARPKRERLLLALGLLAVIGFAADQVLLTPLQARWSQVRVQERALAAQVEALAVQEQLIGRGLPRSTEATLEQARERVRPLLARVNDLQASMLSSNRMEDILSGLIPEGAGLRIVTMKTLPVQDIAALPPQDAASDASLVEPGLQGVYRHAIELQVEGAYLDLMGYVRRIEQSPWKIVVGDLSIQVRQYPRAILTLNLSTFSLEPQWLRLGS